MRRNIGVAINTHRGQLLANGAEDDVGLTSVTVYPSKTFVVRWRLTLLEGALLLSFYTIKSSRTRGLDKRKWDHYDRQEKRRVRRGIGPPELHRHPYIEETMWKRHSISSADSEDSE
jgi:hypothetical protein